MFEEKEEDPTTEKREALVCCVCMETVRKWKNEGRLCMPSMGMHWMCSSCVHTQKNAGVVDGQKCPLCSLRMDKLADGHVFQEFCKLGLKDNTTQTCEALKTLWTQHTECLREFVVYKTVSPPRAYCHSWSNQRFVQWVFDQLYKEDPVSLVTWMCYDRRFRSWMFRNSVSFEFDRWFLLESPFQQVFMATDEHEPDLPFLLTTACKTERREVANIVFEWYSKFHVPIHTRVRALLRAFVKGRPRTADFCNFIWSLFTHGEHVRAPSIIQDVDLLVSISEHGLAAIGAKLDDESKLAMWPLVTNLSFLDDRQILAFIYHWRPLGGTVTQKPWYKTLEGAHFVPSLFARPDGQVFIGPESMVHYQPTEQQSVQGQQSFEALTERDGGVYSVKLSSALDSSKLPVETFSCQLKTNLFLICRPNEAPFVGLSCLSDLDHIQTSENFDSSTVFEIHKCRPGVVLRFLEFTKITILWK